MPVLLVLVFVGVPLLELFVVLQVGAAIGGWPTAGLLIVDSVIGALLLRYEGRRAWSGFRRALAEGRWPGDEVAQGGLIIVGGTLLVTPGFVTDAVGFLLLVAPTRRLVARLVRSRMEGRIVGGAFGDGAARDAGSPEGGSRRGASHGRRRPSRPGDDATVLDIEVVEIRREQFPAVTDADASDADASDVDPGGGDVGPGDVDTDAGRGPTGG